MGWLIVVIYIFMVWLIWAERATQTDHEYIRQERYKEREDFKREIIEQAKREMREENNAGTSSNKS